MTTPTPPFKVRNATGLQLEVGYAVYINGWNSGAGLPTVALADKDTAGSRAQLLVVTAIANGADGFVVAGDQVVTGIDVGAAVVGDPVFMGDAGLYAFTTPPSSGREERIGTVTIAGASGAFYFWPPALHVLQSLS